MLAGEIDSDQVTPPAPGLYGKFEKALKDAIKKFERQSHQETSAYQHRVFQLYQFGYATDAHYRLRFGRSRNMGR